jgi:hypothetical protein
VIAATRLRGGSAASARGAASFAAGAIGTARAGAFFSVTARMDPAVKAAIAAIPAGAWTPIAQADTVTGPGGAPPGA